MSQITQNPWRKRLLVGGLLLIIAFAAVYWYIATDKYGDTKNVKSTYTVEAIPFIKEFIENDSLANARYTDQVITVKGSVSEIESADTTINIKFVDTTTGSYAIFAFQQQHLAEAKTVKVGDRVAI